MSLVYYDNLNQNSRSYLKYIESCRNNDLLRITSFGLFSIVWIADYASSLATADATCKYLKPAYATFHERIIDWGFWNRWIKMEKAMKDYDVNLN